MHVGTSSTVWQFSSPNFAQRRRPSKPVPACARASNRLFPLTNFRLKPSTIPTSLSCACFLRRRVTRDSGIYIGRSLTNRQTPTIIGASGSPLRILPPGWHRRRRQNVDELSALYAFFAGRAGIRGVGLFWPYPNHTVDVWVLRPAGSPPVRVVVPTSQIFLMKWTSLTQINSIRGAKRIFMNTRAAMYWTLSRFLRGWPIFLNRCQRIRGTDGQRRCKTCVIFVKEYFCGLSPRTKHLEARSELAAPSHPAHTRTSPRLGTFLRICCAHRLNNHTGAGPQPAPTSEQRNRSPAPVLRFSTPRPPPRISLPAIPWPSQWA